MRIGLLALLVWALPLQVFAYEKECPIPTLTPGKTAHIELEYIDRQCDTVIIDKFYVVLDHIAERKEESKVECNSAAICTKTIRYFVDPERAKASSYTIVFTGPKLPPARKAPGHVR